MSISKPSPRIIDVLVPSTTPTPISTPTPLLLLLLHLRLLLPPPYARHRQHMFTVETDVDVHAPLIGVDVEPDAVVVNAERGQLGSLKLKRLRDVNVKLKIVSVKLSFLELEVEQHVRIRFPVRLSVPVSVCLRLHSQSQSIFTSGFQSQSQSASQSQSQSASQLALSLLVLWLYYAWLMGLAALGTIVGLRAGCRGVHGVQVVWASTEPKPERVMARCERGVWASEGEGMHTSGRPAQGVHTSLESWGRGSLDAHADACGCVFVFRAELLISLYFFEFVYSVLFCRASCVRSGLELAPGLELELRAGVHTSLGSVALAAAWGCGVA
ncbi:hypothetical protein B0H13DRAFT_2679111 [Mycena leptocephala]|nr:hypothetical protein B0H13DRAFT_2679111 [Mycena leptocephala]